VLLKKKYGRHTTWLGYTRSHILFRFDDINQGERFRGNNSMAHSLSFSHFYKYKNFQCSLGWKYRTGIPYTRAREVTENEGTGPIIVYDRINGAILPDYHRLDLSCSIDFKTSKKEWPKARLGLSLLNLYGRSNLFHREFNLFAETGQNGGQGTVLGEIDRFGLNRTINMVFRLFF